MMPIMHTKTLDIVLLYISLLYIMSILFMSSIKIDLLLDLLAFLNILFLCNPVRYSLIVKLSLITIVLSSILFFTTLFFYNKNNTDFTPQHLAWMIAIRRFSLSFCSYIFILHVNLKKLLYFLLQKFRLPVNFGYSLLVLENAVYYIKQEFIYVRQIYRMRFKKDIKWYTILYNLLVMASRYAVVCSLSLVSRGLSKYKTFVHLPDSYQYTDMLVILLNTISVIIIHVIIS